MSAEHPTSESLRFEVLLNGKRLATTGVGSYGVLTAILMWVRRSPDRIPEHGRDDPSWLAEEMTLGLGGLDSSTDEHVRWLDEQPLKAGDEVTIRIPPPGPVDEAERTASDLVPG